MQRRPYWIIDGGRRVYGVRLGRRCIEVHSLFRVYFKTTV